MNNRSLVNNLWYEFLRTLLIVGWVLGYRIRYSGQRNIPNKGGVLVVSNHQSHLDPPLVGAGCVRRMNYMARDTLFRFGPFRWLISSLDAIPIDREGVGLSGLKESLRRLKRGEMLLVFPEGTRTRDSRGRLGDACKPGIGLIIEQAKPLTLPFYHTGMQDVLPVGAIVPRRGNTVRVLFGQATDCDAHYLEGIASSRTGPLQGRELWQALADATHRELQALEHAVTGAGALSAGSVGRRGG